VTKTWLEEIAVSITQSKVGHTGAVSILGCYLKRSDGICRKKKPLG
jgi:hypothetical protein